MALGFDRALAVLRDDCGTDRARHAYTGAVAAVSIGGRVVLSEAVGRMWADADAPTMNERAIFDVASLTKVMVTTTAVLMLVERGALSLDDRVDAHLPALASAPIGAASIAQLLTHTSGAAWLPLYAHRPERQALLDAIGRAPLGAAPGTSVEYSCTNFILLAWIVERISGLDLADVARRWIFEPLALRDARYLPLATPIPGGVADRLVPTERRADCDRGRELAVAFSGRDDVADAWRERHPRGLARGVAHDENAAWLGGVAGNAGVFASAADVLAFGGMCLAGGRRDGIRVLSRASIDASRRDRTSWADEHRGLGWKLNGPNGSLCDLASPTAYGHTGFTGAALLVDPDRDLVAVLLAARLPLGRENDRIVRTRRLFFNAVVAALE